MTHPLHTQVSYLEVEVPSSAFNVQTSCSLSTTPLPLSPTHPSQCRFPEFPKKRLLPSGRGVGWGVCSKQRIGCELNADVSRSSRCRFSSAAGLWPCQALTT